MDLSAHTILVVEPNVTPFTARLQAAIEHEGARSILVRTAAEASDQIKQSRLTAAVVSAEHRALAEQLGIQYVLYVPSEPPSTIIADLRTSVAGAVTTRAYRLSQPRGRAIRASTLKTLE